jgi:hypothetical protein
MTERETNWLFIFLALLALILSIWTFGCGVNQMFEEIRPNYFLNTSQDGSDLIKDTIILGIDTYNEHFGQCSHRVDIVMRSVPFDCGGPAAGCSFGGLIDVGVDPFSECETIRALLHELSHACRYVQDNYILNEPNWTWELNDITYQLFLDGKCVVDENGLYSNYCWN